jgi:hypothetical protein
MRATASGWLTDASRLDRRECTGAACLPGRQALLQFGSCRRLIGGIGEYENSVRMAYVRGPEGNISSLFEQIG